jgi:ABC-type multidrug transport system fused ATPase/permease subunit
MKKKRTDFFYNIVLLYGVNKPFLVSIWKRNPAYYFVQLCVLITSGFSATISALLPKLFVDSIVEGQSISVALLFIVALAIYSFVNSVVYSLFANYKLIVYERARNDSKIKAIHFCQRLLHSYFDTSHNRDLIHRAFGYAAQGGERFLEALWMLLTNIISIVSIVLVFDVIRIWMIIWLILLNVIRLLINRKTEKIRFEFSKKKTIFDRQQGYFMGVMSGHPTLEELNVNDGIIKKTEDYFNVAEENISLTKSHHNNMLRWSSISTGLAAVQTIVVYGYIGVGMVRGEFTLGDYTAILLTLSRMDAIINALIDFPRRILPQALDAENYVDFINTPDVEKTAEEHINSIETIEFENVFFKYPGTESYILENICFKLIAPQKYAIVGVNGAGKSTLVKLIMKFYYPTKGEIYINGINIKNISRESLWNCLGYVPQNINLYSTTVYDNVDLANKYDSASVEKALDFVGLSKKIEVNEYNHVVSRMFDDNGWEYSIGERQKFAIARALIKNPSMFVFDEPTSSLDAESEYEILDTLWKLSDSCLTIMISHRLSCTRKMDKIIFISNRQISHIGNHDELFVTCDEYRQMFQKQASQYVDN